jgi:branched-chain amino acid aminotransferase
MALPFDQRDGFIWFDGKIVDWKDAKVHVLTHGLHYGSSVFEGERAYGGVIFKMQQHHERLKKSAEILGFEIPWTVDQINAAGLEIMKKNGLTDCYLRPVAWRGSEMMGVSAQHNTIHLAIACWDWPSYFKPEERARGIRVDIADYRRPDPRTAPSASKAAGLYMICTISKHAAERKGFADALMFDYEGYVAEATGANVFFVQDGKLHTPMADRFLNGITRQTVIELAKRRGIEVIERRILPHELGYFTEAFFTGSAAEITPVGEIGPFKFTPGAITSQLVADYTAETHPKAKAAAAE